MRRFLTSCFGLGRLPVMPGTFGSLPAAIVFWLLAAAGARLAVLAGTMAGIIVAASAVCVAFAPAVIALTNKKDPREIVVDELAGQALSFVTVLTVRPQDAFIAAAAGFVLFRIFDIAKPWPVNKLEGLPAGWGILADDLMAGVYAGICLLILARVWIVR